MTTELGFEMFIIVGSAFVGWFLFTMFGGVGFAALPIDMIQTYTKRPKLKGPKEMAETAITLRLRTTALIDMAKMIKNERQDTDLGGFWAKRKAVQGNRTSLNTLKKKIFDLEEAVLQYNMERFMSVNPFVAWVWLILGIFFGIFSIILYLHIFFYILIAPDGIPLHDFLNSVLEWIEMNIASFFSSILFILIALYCLWCTLTGTFKFGLRIFVFFPIHPMR